MRSLHSFACDRLIRSYSERYTNFAMLHRSITPYLTLLINRHTAHIELRRTTWIDGSDSGIGNLKYVVIIMLHHECPSLCSALLHQAVSPIPCYYNGRAASTRANLRFPCHVAPACTLVVRAQRPPRWMDRGFCLPHSGLG